MLDTISAETRSEQAVTALGAQLRGELIRPGDACYDEARRSYNSILDKRPALIARETEMKTRHPRWRPWLLALTLTLLTLTSVGLGTTTALAQVGAQAVRRSMVPQCDPNELMHAATQQYRMFYDQGYASAQRIAAATNQYRQFYDQQYSAEQRLAAATSEYCRGGQ